MKTLKVKVYQFDELPENIQEKVIDKNREINVHDDWWKSIYYDAKQVGLKITSFDLDRNRHANGEFINDADFCAEKILENHCNTCETYKTAANYMEERNKLDIDEQEEELAKLDEQFLVDILEDYSIMLQNEYEYLQSDESVKETLIINEYTYLEDGRPFN